MLYKNICACVTWKNSQRNGTHCASYHKSKNERMSGLYLLQWSDWAAELIDRLRYRYCWGMGIPMGKTCTKKIPPPGCALNGAAFLRWDFPTASLPAPQTAGAGWPRCLSGGPRLEGSSISNPELHKKDTLSWWTTLLRYMKHHETFLMKNGMVSDSIHIYWLWTSFL